MPADTPTPSGGRVFAAFGVMVAVIALPILVAIYTPGSWIVKLTATVGMFSVGFLVGAFALHALMGSPTVEQQRPGRMPTTGGDTPGHHIAPAADDPVYYVAWGERGRGCTDPEPHGPHPWHWRSDMPYATGDGTVYATAPVRGAVPCPGVKEP